MINSNPINGKVVIMLLTIKVKLLAIVIEGIINPISLIMV